MLMQLSCECEHGQEFDNRSRWCAVCERTVAVENDPDEFEFIFSGKKCPTCSALWPEYVEEFLDGFQDDPLYQMLFGIGETVH
jgi:hypothetical protein